MVGVILTNCKHITHEDYTHTHTHTKYQRNTLPHTQTQQYQKRSTGHNNEQQRQINTTHPHTTPSTTINTKHSYTTTATINTTHSHTTTTTTINATLQQYHHHHRRRHRHQQKQQQHHTHAHDTHLRLFLIPPSMIQGTGTPGGKDWCPPGTESWVGRFCPAMASLELWCRRTPRTCRRCWYTSCCASCC